MTSLPVPHTFRFQRVAVVGLGLIGGSIVRALRAAGFTGQVSGCDADAATVQSALEGGWIDQAIADPAALFAHCDIVLLCQPVSVMLGFLSAHLTSIGSGHAVVMDVASVKTPVVRALAGSAAAGRFVPSHPIAGRAESGWAAARADLFRDRPCIITPCAGVAPEAEGLACNFWASLGARMARMPADEHDRAFAAISHLPQVLTYAYLHGLAARPGVLAWVDHHGPGFQGFTRLGASDAGLWADIAMQNAGALVDEIDSVQNALALFRRLLVHRKTDELHGAFSAAKEFHAAALKTPAGVDVRG